MKQSQETKTNASPQRRPLSRVGPISEATENHYCSFRCPKCGASVELRGYNQEHTKERYHWNRVDRRVFTTDENGWKAYARCEFNYNGDNNHVRCDFQEEIFIGVI